MLNGLRSKATGGGLYEMQPVVSSAHLHRQARMNGGESMEEAPSQENYGENSQSSRSSGGSVVSLMGLLAFGAAAALAIIENEEISEKMEGIKGLLGFGSTQCDEKNEEEHVLPDHLAAQPLHLQRQR